MKPWLLIPPKLAHDLAPIGLDLLATFRELETPVWRPFSWNGIEFKNRLGIAGGVDKDGASVESWWKFGAGFIEIGTVTPFAQGPNNGKIIDRDTEREALWNRMGFPGVGAKRVRENLSDLPRPRATPIFMNIGKNRATPNDKAAGDYIACLRELDGLADAWVVNISSPNTTGLRDLFKPAAFRAFLEPLLEERTKLRTRAMLLKLSPDLTDEDLENVVTTASQMGLDGFIATNTTLAREPGMHFSNEGGVSGRPLAARSKATLSKVLQILGSTRKDKLIISAGGVIEPDDVLERLALGADLVQVYAALIFHGPWFFDRVTRRMELPQAK